MVRDRALNVIRRLVSRLERFCDETKQQRILSSYLNSDRRPWQTGYGEYRANYLADVVTNDTILGAFCQGKSLPHGYGFRLDARVVEIPWVLSRIKSQKGKLLDAGSSLNYDFVLKSCALANKQTTIITLAPEGSCHWTLSVSYLFGDLCKLDLRDDLFDMIVCISTIEHIGMDNSLYAGKAQIAQRSNSKEFLRAIEELRRVLKPGGALYITFPFGQYEDHGWFQQFDSSLVDALVEAFTPAHVEETVFRYDSDGWKFSDRASCTHCQFFDVRKSKYFDPNSNIEYPPDYPAGERAVACLELRK